MLAIFYYFIRVQPREVVLLDTSCVTMTKVHAPHQCDSEGRKLLQMGQMGQLNVRTAMKVLSLILCQIRLQCTVVTKMEANSTMI